jgi:hypothetical protein
MRASPRLRFSSNPKPMLNTTSKTLTADSDQEKINWLRLARSENIGRSTFFRLNKIFGSAKNA